MGGLSKRLILPHPEGRDGSSVGCIQAQVKGSLQVVLDHIADDQSITGVEKGAEKVGLGPRCRIEDFRRREHLEGPAAIFARAVVILNVIDMAHAFDHGPSTGAGSRCRAEFHEDLGDLQLILQQAVRDAAIGIPLQYL
jgi:hypothetical protein